MRDPCGRRAMTAPGVPGSKAHWPDDFGLRRTSPRFAGALRAQRGWRRIVFIRLNGRCAECPPEQTPRSPIVWLTTGGDQPGCSCQALVRRMSSAVSPSTDGNPLARSAHLIRPEWVAETTAPFPASWPRRERSGSPSVLFRRACTTCSHSATGRRELPRGSSRPELEGRLTGLGSADRSRRCLTPSRHIHYGRCNQHLPYHSYRLTRVVPAGTTSDRSKSLSARELRSAFVSVARLDTPILPIHPIDGVLTDL